MKKTMLLLLVLCSIGYNSFAQKKKKRSFTIDTVYFDSSNRNFSYDLTLKDSIIVGTAYNFNYSSEETDFVLTKRVHLDNNSGSKDMVIAVTDNTPELLLSVECNLESGILAIEIYDPKGNKRGNFSVKGDNSNDKSGWSEVVEGFINKRFTNPLRGDWTIKFISKKVTADIIINTKLK